MDGRDGGKKGKKFRADKKKLLEYTAQLDTLQFKQALLDLQYYADWDEHVIDIKRERDSDWDGEEEADEGYAEARRLAYAAIKAKLGDNVRHLSTGMRPGDARGLFKRISNRSCSLTTGAIQALKEEVNG